MSEDRSQKPRPPEQAGRLRPGTIIDHRFTLVRRLGAGSSGVVWAARDQQREADVALKILHPQLSGDAALVSQLAREAQVLERLDHPNITRALAFKGQGPFIYLAMELLSGKPLNEAIGEHTRSGRHFRGRVLAHLVEQICAGVAHAHEAGIVHRDLKPQNIIVRPQDGLLHAKVLDFGIARLSEGSLFDATTLGRRMGSLFYMSPEQTQGEPADARSDVFALGCILFELLTLRRAWAWDEQQRPLAAFDAPVAHSESNSIAAVFSRISSPERPRPSAIRRELPRALDEIVATAMAVDPADRYPDVASLARAAREALETLTRQMEAARGDWASGPEDPTVGVDGMQAHLQQHLAPLDADEQAATDRRSSPTVAPTLAHPAVMAWPAPNPDGPTRPAPRTQSLAAPDDTTGANPVPATVPFSAASPEPRAPLDDLATALMPGLDPAEIAEALRDPKDTLPPAAPPAREPQAERAAGHRPAEGGGPKAAAPTELFTAELPRGEFLAPAPVRVPRRAGFADLEEAGPTVWESTPDAAAPVQAAIDTATTAGARPLKRWGILMAAVGLGVAGSVAAMTLSGRPRPAPLQNPNTTPGVVDAPPVPRVEFPALRALLTKVKANPKDDAALDALTQGILRAAKDVGDPGEREDIQQIATLSRTVRNIEGLASCLNRLETAANR